MSNTEGKIIKVRIAASATTINEVFHDETLKGTGQPDSVLGIADSVLENIDSKVADVQVNGTSVVSDNVANITVGDATLTIQKNGTAIDTFTANATEDKSINIEVPTKLSDISTVGQQAAIDSGITSTDVAQITTNKNDITTINDKIPTQASSSNKLADKNFVNSSISTNTANFIGTFNSVAELEAYTGTVTNNDYAFVISEDTAGNTVYNRYKYTTATTPASWQFEYALNNSSFTADQWAAINSGATTTNIGQIATNTSTISGHIANKNNPHEVTKAQVGLGNVDNTSDANKPVSTAQQAALDLKANSADVYTKTAADSLLAAKANTALSNLTDAGKNISNWSTNVSNCLVEIPQDINLTLSDGTLTLKSGSKFYMPDGTAITTTSDQTWSTTTMPSSNLFVFLSRYGNAVGLYGRCVVENCSSGSSLPSTVPSAGSFFNTSDNTIYVANNGVWDASTSGLPIAIVKSDADRNLVSIDKVFNGFGYMGSTVFALPGVKGLAAAGRKSDGSLNSFLVTLDSVKTVSSALSRSGKLCVQSTGSMFFAIDYVYDEAKNRIYNYGLQTAFCAGDLVYNAGRVESLTPRKVLHAVDYNDFADLQTTVENKADKATTLSGYGITDAYTKSATDTLLNAKASTSLDNLNNTGANIGNWSHNVSNCLVEIPQDINLELSSGTLTLKSGSKSYLPNGAGTFTAVTTTADKSTTSTTNGSALAFLTSSGATLALVAESNCVSGSSDSLAGTSYHIWYDTTNNTINYYGSDGTTVSGTRCLPCAKVTVSGGAISSIDQVFNGFGFIGSTIFALPGVKGVMPNGRNANGTLKNTILNNQSVKTTSASNGSYSIRLNNAQLAVNAMLYDEKENKNYLSPKSDANFRECCICGTMTATSNVISSLNIKTAFHAVDYSEITSVLMSVDGYDSSKTQTLKNVQGVISWVDDA